MLPIDKTINCERLLETKQYQTTNHRSEEDLWLFKYLKNKKKTKEEIFDIWMTIYPNKYERSKDDMFPEKTFECLYKHIGSVRLKNNYHDIIVYKSELDWINSRQCNRWEKEYMLLFLAYCRLKNNYSYENLPYRDLLTLTSVPRVVELNKAKITKMFDEFEVVYKNTVVGYEDLPEIDDRGFQIGYRENVQTKRTFRVCRFEKYDSSEEKVIHLKTFADVPKCLDMITMNRVCECCGKVFEYSNKTKKNICDECFEEQQRLKSNAYALKSMTKDRCDFKICNICGTLFEFTPHCRRNCCDRCYAKKEKERKKFVAASIRKYKKVAG